MRIVVNGHFGPSVWWISAVLTLAALLSAQPAAAGDAPHLRVVDLNAPAGGRAVVSVQLDAGQPPPAAANITVGFDDTFLNFVEARLGNAAGQAYTIELEEQDPGEIELVIFALADVVLSDGILLTLVFEVAPAAPTGAQLNVVLTEVDMSDRTGTQALVPVIDNGVIQVGFPVGPQCLASGGRVSAADSGGSLILLVLMVVALAYAGRARHGLPPPDASQRADAPARAD